MSKFPKVTPQSLDLTMNGSFRVLTAHDTSVRCGPHGTQRTIKYTATIKSHPSLLDGRGFIIDWRDILQTVAHHYKYVNKFPSCESFASEICGIIVGLLKGRCGSVEVDVGIDRLPAHMTASYTPEEPTQVSESFQTQMNGLVNGERQVNLDRKVDRTSNGSRIPFGTT